VQGVPATPGLDLTRRREVIDAFLAASRRADFRLLLALLDPDVIFRADHTALGLGAPAEAYGDQRPVSRRSGRPRPSGR
jgi:hypothetical protein